MKELLASENKCFLNRRLVYEQYFWFFFLDSGLCFLISSHHLLKINSLFLSQMMLLLWKSQFSSLNLHFEWKKKVFLLSQEWWLFFSRMTTLKQCISRSLVDTIWWYLLLITKLRGLSQITFAFFGIFWPRTPLVCTFFVINYTFFWPPTHPKCKRNLWKFPT